MDLEKLNADEDIVCFINIIQKNPTFKAKILTIIGQLDNVINQIFWNNIVKEYEKKDFERNLDIFIKKTNQETSDAFQNCFDLFNSSKDIINYEKEEKIRKNKYPFDIFGTTFFLSFLSHLSPKFNNNFTKNISKEMVVSITNNEYKNLKNKIAHISLLRHYLEHNGTPSKTNLEALNGEIIINKLNLEESFNHLFSFIPTYLSKNIADSVLYKKQNCSIVFNENFANKIMLLQQNSVETLRKYHKTLNSNKFSKNLNDKYFLEKNLFSFIKPTNLYDFIKRYNFIGLNNILKTQGIIKDFIEVIDENDLKKAFKKTEINRKKIKKNVFLRKESKHKEISFDEAEYIFNFLMSINEILRKYFIHYYEKLDNQHKNNNRQKKLRNAISHSDLFLEKFDTNLRYIERLKIAVFTILSFYDEEYKNCLENENHNYKQMKSSFIMSFKALCNKKDYLYITSTKNNDAKIHKLKIEQKKQLNKKDIKEAIKKGVDDIKNNPNNKDWKIFVNKFVYLNMVRKETKKMLLEIKKENQKCKKN